jgi:hypothetical protein
MKLHKQANHLIYLVYLLIAFIGGFLAFRAMTWGPWAFSDSSAYVSAARNFASGNGFVIYQSTGEIKILKEFPPFFPVLLSIFGGIKLDYINTLRWWNIFLFSSSTLLISLNIHTATRKHYLSIMAALFFVFSPQIVTIYSSAMSEPLFLFLLLLSLLLYQLISRRDNKLSLFMFLVITSLLPITRYAGILFVGVFGASLFIFSQNSRMIKRIRNTALYYIFTLLPVGLWLFSLFDKFNMVGGKRFSLDISIFQNIASSVFDVSEVIKFWIPYVEIYRSTFTEILIILFSAILAIFLVGSTTKQFISSNKATELNKKHFFFLVILLIFGYVLFISLTHSITIPQIDIIDRMMIPIYPLCIFVFFLSADALIDKIGQKCLLIFIVALSFLGLRYNFLRTNSYIKTMEENGHGFTARAYQQSGLINEIRKLSLDQEIISNSSGFVLFYTNRYPIQVNDFPNYAYGSGNSYGEYSFRENNAALIILFSDFSNYYGEKSENLLYSLTNTLNDKYIDIEGGVYYYR